VLKSNASARGRRLLLVASNSNGSSRNGRNNSGLGRLGLSNVRRLILQSGARLSRSNLNNNGLRQLGLNSDRRRMLRNAVTRSNRSNVTVKLQSNQCLRRVGSNRVLLHLSNDLRYRKNLSRVGPSSGLRRPLRNVGSKIKQNNLNR
jgi:hypothetical protein